MISLIIPLFNLLNIPRGVTSNYCDIKGSVKNPGVYEVKEGEVINDIIKKAGGLTKNSYVKNINLSKKVKDEMVIYILSQDEFEDLSYVCPVCDCEGVTYNTCESETREEETTSESTTKKMTTTKKTTTTKEITTTKTTTEPTTETKIININTASLEELMQLKGVGEVVARSIIEYRQEHPFEVIEDLLKVKGIGDKLFEKIKEYITV